MLFFTRSWKFLRSNKLEQLECKLEKIIGIQKHAGKVRKRFFQKKSWFFFLHALKKRKEKNSFSSNQILRPTDIKFEFSDWFWFIKTLYWSINLEIFEKNTLLTSVVLSGTYLKLKLPLNRSYRRAAANAVPSLRMCWLGLNRLLVPWLAAAALMALGARQSPTLSNKWPRDAIP